MKKQNKTCYNPLLQLDSRSLTIWDYYCSETCVAEATFPHYDKSWNKSKNDSESHGYL